MAKADYPLGAVFAPIGLIVIDSALESQYSFPEGHTIQRHRGTDRIPGPVADETVDMVFVQGHGRVAVLVKRTTAVSSFGEFDDAGDGILPHWDESEDGLSEADVTCLAEGTLAFFLADDQKKEHIRELFQLLAGNISANITDPARRKIYGRTLYGIQDAQAIEGWVQSNADSLLPIVNETEVLDLAWPLLTRHINGGVFTKFDKPEVLKEISHGWINGKPFSDLQKIIRKRKAKMIWGTRRREFKIDHVVEVCEGTLAYDGALVVGAVCEFIETLAQDGTRDLINRLQLFQKRLKYGLPTETTIALYELGFSDRVISQDLAASLNLAATQKKDLVKALKRDRDGARTVMDKYPAYFQERMNELL